MLVLLIVLLLFDHLSRLRADSCTVVRRQFSDMQLGNPDFVPHSFQEGYSGVCNTGECCSPEMESAFRKRVRQDYSVISRTHFEHLYNSVKSRSEHFQMSIERYLLHSTRLSLQTCTALESHKLLTTVSIQKGSVFDLYSNITSYFKQVHRVKETSVKRLIKTFVKQSMGIKKTKSVPCIKDIATKLEEALDAAWLIKESLKFVRSLFGSIRGMRVSDECVDALVQMNFCSMCQPNGVFQIAEACPKYCVNVHKGCLAPILHVSPKITEWSRLIQTMLQDLRRENSLFEAVSGLNLLVHSVVVNNTEKELCTHEQHSFKDKAERVLDFHLSALEEELTLFEDVFDSLPHQLCDKLHLNPGSENHCWNGTHMSNYNCRIADNGLKSANPTQVVMSDPMLEQQDARLREILFWLYAHTNSTPPPTPEVEFEEMCGVEISEHDTDNMSNKRHHSENATEIPYRIPNTRTSNSVRANSSRVLVVLFIPLRFICHVT